VGEKFQELYSIIHGVLFKEKNSGVKEYTRIYGSISAIVIGKKMKLNQI
jgi:hypothetical protein